MSASRALCMMALIVSMPPPDASAQTTYTNDNVGSTLLNWDDTLNWNPSGIPGFRISNSTGDSNDSAVINFLTTGSATEIPQIDFNGEEYVLSTLTIYETTNANQNADGNILNGGGLGGNLFVTQTLERIEYLTGGRQIDVFPGVTFKDKPDGKPFELFMGGSTLDLGGGLAGTEGLVVSNNQVLYVRGFESMSFGSSTTNGLTFTGVSGSAKNFYFDAITGSVTQTIPNLSILNDGAETITFGRQAGTNQVTVNIQNVILNTNTVGFRIGGDSFPSRTNGTPGTTVNINGQVDFSAATTSANRTIQIASIFGGIVNFNSNIVINQDLQGTGRTLTWSGNGVARVNANVIQTNGSLVGITNIIDGARSLVVDVNAESRLGTGVIDLRNGSVLRMNYNVFSNSYPGSSMRYGENANIFLDFGSPQTGFYDPIVNNVASGLVVRAFNGISGNLVGASYTNASGYYANNTISFQTNAIIGETASGLPTRAQLGGAILYQGIQTAGGTYTNIGDDGSTSIFKGVAISALAPLGSGDLPELDPFIGVEDVFQAGFHGTLTARPGQDLEVLIPGDVFFTAANFYTNAQFNADTRVAYLRGPGVVSFQRRLGADAWGGNVTNLIRVGTDGTGLFGITNPENPLAIDNRNSIIVDLLSAVAVPDTKTLTVRNGQVRVRQGDQLGLTTLDTNTTLAIGTGGSLLPDDTTGNNAAQIALNRGRVVFEEDGALYTGTQPDRLDVSTNFMLQAISFVGNRTLFIINDGSAGTAGLVGTRFLTNAAPSGVRPYDVHDRIFNNMNIIFGDNALSNLIVNASNSFTLGEGRYLTHARNSDGNFMSLRAVDYAIVYTNTISGSVTNYFPTNWYGSGLVDAPITAGAGVTQVHFIANRDGANYRTFDINPSVLLTNTDLIAGRTNDFITVNDDTSTRSLANGSGTLRLDGASNVFRNVQVVSGAIRFHDEYTDQTRINGNLIIDPVNAGNTNPNNHIVFGGDFSVASNIVINASRSLPATNQITHLTIDARGDDFNAFGSVTNGDGRGLMDRLVSGTLAGGPDGIVINEYGLLEIIDRRTFATNTISQKITIDNGGPNFNGGRRTLDFNAQNGIGGVTSTTGTVTFQVPNIVMRDNAHLRINEGNSHVRVGLTLEGTGYLGDGNSTDNDDFDLLNVRSSVNGVGRLLYIGGTNSSLSDPDTNLDASLFGTGTPDITFYVFNNTFRSQVSSGGDVQGNVIVRSGSTFAIVGGLDAINDLSGNGIVAGAVQVGRTCSPGLAAFTPATLTVNGSNLFTSTSILNFDLAGSNTVMGNAINDYLAIGGAGYLELDGTLNVNGLSSFAGRGTNDFWTIITYAGSFTNNTLNLGVMPVLDAGLAWAIDTSVNGQVRLGIVIPEPTTWALIGIGLGVIAVASRRRR